MIWGSARESRGHEPQIRVFVFPWALWPNQFDNDISLLAGGRYLYPVLGGCHDLVMIQMLLRNVAAFEPCTTPP